MAALETKTYLNSFVECFVEWLWNVRYGIYLWDLPSGLGSEIWDSPLNHSRSLLEDHH